MLIYVHTYMYRNIMQIHVESAGADAVFPFVGGGYGGGPHFV